jgi:hypothetical protein
VWLGSGPMPDFYLVLINCWLLLNTT